MIKKRFLLLMILMVASASAIALFYFTNYRHPRDLTVRVAYPWLESPTKLDTANILTLYEYELIHNLYSRLVEYDSSWQLVPGVAQSLKTNKNEAIFTFNGKSTTISGHKIDAVDAELSLKRILILGRSDIHRLLCPNHKLKSINDSCPGIRVENGQLILKPFKPHYLPMLISALELTDYSIVPRSAVDWQSKEMKIVDFQNTSGPYFIESYSDNGSMVFKANPNHYHYDLQMPQTVKFLPTDTTMGLFRLAKGEVDLVTTVDNFNGIGHEKILQDHTKFTIHVTQPFQYEALFFSKNAVKKFTVQQRLYVASVIAGLRWKLAPVMGAIPTKQFFQAMSDGALNPKQLNEINQLHLKAGKPKFSEPIKWAIYKNAFAKFEGQLRDHPEIVPIKIDKIAMEYDPESRPDVFVQAGDSAWTEDISMLGYNFEAGLFHSIGTSTKSWFSDYLNTPEKVERIKKLNQLHFDLLRKAIIVPFRFTPFYAASNKKWRLNFPEFSPDTDLWKMRPY